MKMVSNWLIQWYFFGLVQDIKKVPEDIAELKPTLFVGVPRVFDRLTAGQLIVQKINLVTILIV